MRPSRSTGCNNAGAAGGVGDEPSGTAGVLVAPPASGHPVPDTGAVRHDRSPLAGAALSVRSHGCQRRPGTAGIQRRVCGGRTRPEISVRNLALAGAPRTSRRADGVDVNVRRSRTTAHHDGGRGNADGSCQDLMIGTDQMEGLQKRSSVRSPGSSGWMPRGRARREQQLARRATSAAGPTPPRSPGATARARPEQQPAPSNTAAARSNRSCRPTLPRGNSLARRATPPPARRPALARSNSPRTEQHRRRFDARSPEATARAPWGWQTPPTSATLPAHRRGSPSADPSARPLLIAPECPGPGG